MRHLGILALLLFVPTQASCGASGPRTAPLSHDERSECFDVVAKTISDNFYDPLFGAVAWEEVTARYRPRAMRAVGDRAFFVSMNERRFELGVSHLGLIPDEHP